MRAMKTFVAGLIVGLVLGGGLVYAQASISSNGYLTGWDVRLTGGGEPSVRVCKDPYAWVGTKEIECRR